MSNFGKYSAFYDLLYLDKDYVAEADYVANTIRSAVPAARNILELGSGTGRHGRLLAAMGFTVHGVERSPEMVAQFAAHRDLSSAGGGGDFTCEVGDICKIDLGRTFDAVVALFHVVSYQTSNEALRAAFQVAANHLMLGGVFMFDVWHGPAVLMQRPSQRVKNVQDEIRRVKRTAFPELDTDKSIVKVRYEMECEDLLSRDIISFNEDHLMRYLFPTEIEMLANVCGFRILKTEEFLTGAPPSPATWGVNYVLQR